VKKLLNIDLAAMSIKYLDEEHRIISSMKLAKGVYTVKFKSNQEAIIREVIGSLNKLVVRDDFDKYYKISKKLGEGSFSEVHLVTKIRKPASAAKPVKRFAAKMLSKTQVLKSFRGLD
jgi:hypothetical protein